jgi:uncharacterized protein YneF (UPF0154 family)
VSVELTIALMLLSLIVGVLVGHYRTARRYQQALREPPHEIDLRPNGVER